MIEVVDPNGVRRTVDLTFGGMLGDASPSDMAAAMRALRRIGFREVAK